MVSIQYGATLGEGLFPAIGAQGTTTLRLGFAAIILGIAMRPWRLRPSRRIAPALIGYGAALAAMSLLFYMALETIPLGIAVALEFSGPLLVAVLSSRRRVDFTWIVLAVAGLLLLSPPVHTQHSVDPTGVILALGSGACWALYILFGQKAGRELGSQATAFGMAVAAILVLPVGVVHAGGALFKPPVLLSAVAVGVFSSALPFSLEMVALTRLPARVYGTLTSMEPAIGALMGLILLHQTLTGLQWTGITVVIAAAVGAAASMATPIASPE